MRPAEIDALLLSEPTTLNPRDLEAVKCAGLITEWPPGTFFLGPSCHRLFAGLIGKPIDFFSPSQCIHGTAIEHEGAISYCEELESQSQGKSHLGPLLTEWQKLLAGGASPRQLLRQHLPIRNEATFESEVQSQGSSVDWAPLLQSAENQLILSGRGSPENGPAFWTICWVLSMSPSGLPMRISDLRREALDLLASNKVRDERIDAIAMNSFIKIESGLDGEQLCSIDYSGRTHTLPTTSNRTLAALPGLIRGEGFWAWPITQDQTAVSQSLPFLVLSIPLTLAVFLASHALRNVRRNAYGSTRNGLAAIAIVMERVGRLILRSGSIPTVVEGVTHLTIADTGELRIAQLSDLSDLGAQVPNVGSTPESTLRYVAERLGLSPDPDEETFVLPRTLREQLHIKEGNGRGLFGELLALVEKSSKELTDG